MRRKRSTTLGIAALVVLVPTILTACNKAPGEGTAPASNTAAPTATAKLPITTSSEEARKQYIEGRDKAERLLITDSLQNFDKAIELDPNFALAELARANSSQSAKEFFDHLAKAVALADKASEGEKLLILGTNAGANNDAAKQKEYFDKLVTLFPGDERVQVIVGGYYFGQQDYTTALTHYKESIKIAPAYAPAYNIAGYAYRQTDDYANAEQSFKKYIELIPNDPNPYDSYAELLLKMGRFDESIVQYRKALSIDPTFMASHSGISADLVYSGKPADATAELQIIMDKARNEGDQRTALFGMTVVDVDGGNMAGAIANVDKQYALGEKTNDVAAMAGDLQTKGNILLEMGKADDAAAAYAKSVSMTDQSSLSQEIKDAAKLQAHYDNARVALAKKDAAKAKAEAAEFQKGADASKNPTTMRQAHQLAGIIAMSESNYDVAIAELMQASMQNPQNLYWLAMAYKGKGDAAKATEFAKKAANFNSLPNLNYAFIRTKAKAMAGA
ncbi:MAG TPA: tetratricopeptide repeat protein [Blastocatellia bacterium]|nr:tetratricopeptide repeat protein [Blastocatellia bacterium]